jgi:hypothetical protein
MIFEEALKPKLKKVWQKTPEPIKQVLLICAVLIVITQTMITVWSAIHSAWISAYDERWYELARPHMNARDNQLTNIRAEIKIIGTDVADTKEDVRDMRVFLMGPKK